MSSFTLRCFFAVRGVSGRSDKIAPRKPESSAACAGVAKAIGASAEQARSRLRTFDMWTHPLLVAGEPRDGDLTRRYLLG